MLKWKCNLNQTDGIKCNVKCKNTMKLLLQQNKELVNNENRITKKYVLQILINIKLKWQEKCTSCCKLI